MASVTSASRNVMSMSHYQSRSSMYIRDLIPRNSTELAKAVLITDQAGIILSVAASRFSLRIMRLILSRLVVVCFNSISFLIFRHILVLITSLSSVGLGQPGQKRRLSRVLAARTHKVWMLMKTQTINLDL